MAGGGVRGPLDEKVYPGRLTWSVKIACLCAAMGGLIFGYDIGISGGVTSMAPFLMKFFPSVYEKETHVKLTNGYCTFNSVKLTFFTSSLYIAALVASLVASWFTKKFGRKLTMLSGGLLFCVGAILNAAAQNVEMLIFGRILLGCGIGFANQAVPIYLSEMAPSKHRGKINVMFQMSITIGILFANLLNYFFAQIKGGWGWRLSLGGAIVPALFFIIGSLCISDTPNSMIARGKLEEAKEKLRVIRGVPNVDEEYNDILYAFNESQKVQEPWKNLLKRRYRPQLTFAIGLPFFQQFTGMNVIMFYAPVLFKTIGFGDKASLASALITGVVNWLSTFISVALVDRCGRKKLFIWGGWTMFVCHVIIAIAIASKFGTSGYASSLPMWYAVLVVIFICLFVNAFAYSWGPLGWLVPSEIFPMEIRSAGQSLTVSVNMFFTFVIAEIFLPLLCVAKYGLFIFFAVFVFVMQIFIHKLLPETKGKPIEEMDEVWRNHKIWRNIVPPKEGGKSGGGKGEIEIIKE